MSRAATDQGQPVGSCCGVGGETARRTTAKRVRAAAAAGHQRRGASAQLPRRDSMAVANPHGGRSAMGPRRAGLGGIGRAAFPCRRRCPASRRGTERRQRQLQSARRRRSSTSSVTDLPTCPQHPKSRRLVFATFSFFATALGSVPAWCLSRAGKRLSNALGSRTQARWRSRRWASDHGSTDAARARRVA